MRVKFYFCKEEDRNQQPLNDIEKQVFDIGCLPRKGEYVNVDIDGTVFVGEVYDIWSFYQEGKHYFTQILAKYI